MLNNNKKRFQLQDMPNNGLKRRRRKLEKPGDEYRLISVKLFVQLIDNTPRINYYICTDNSSVNSTGYGMWKAMDIIITTQENAAKQAAERYIALLQQKPNAVLGFATGSTPLLLYAELVRACQSGRLSFQNARSFNLDEYVGLEENHPQSYRYFMNQNLFSKIDIPLENTLVPSGKTASNAQAIAYEEAIQAAGGIDLQLLGIGQNGHIGFNEPGTPFGSKTHLVRLSESTRVANARFFSSVEEVPKEAVTMGIRTVMNARTIILFAEGASKARILDAAINGPVTETVPASVLQLHPNVTLYLDAEAAKYL